MMRETRTHFTQPFQISLLLLTTLALFAINNGMSAAVTDLASPETVTERKFLRRRNNATLTFVTIFKLLGQLFHSALR